MKLTLIPVLDLTPLLTSSTNNNADHYVFPPWLLAAKGVSSHIKSGRSGRIHHWVGWEKMMGEKRVLIIEDDRDAAQVLEAYLQREHFTVSVAGDGLKGLEMALRWKPDLILLDVMLPGISGTEILSQLRKKSDMPVIMITAMGDATDKIGALRYGADDYIVKPYHPGEVMARVHAVMRRYSGQTRAVESLSFGPLRMDTEAMTASVETASGGTQFLELTPTEFSLLATLLRAPTKAFSRQDLLEKCLPESEAMERVVDTHIYNLRKKLEVVGITEVLITVRAIGYRFRQP